MKFKVSSAEFYKAVLAVARVIPSDAPSKPILKNILLEVKENELVLTATDEELTLRTSVGITEVDEDGTICVPSGNLQDLLKEMPDVVLSLEATSNNSFVCKWPKGEGQIPYSSAEDYPLPALDIPKDASKITIKAETLLKAIATTICATDNEATRPALMGIYFDIYTDKTTLVATDASQLIAYTLPEVKGNTQDSFILHKTPAKIITSIVAKDGGDIEIVFDEQKVYIKADNVLLICRKIIGRFPAYLNVIPKNNNRILTIDRTLLLGMIRRISSCANKSNNSIRFNVHDNLLELSACDTEFKISAHEETSCEYNSAEPISIAFNSSLLVNIISHFNVEGIKIAFADNTNKAVLITPAEDGASLLQGILVPTVVR